MPPTHNVRGGLAWRELAAFWPVVASMAAMVGISEMPIMTTTFARYGKAKRAQQLGLTAVTFLMLSIWIRPDRACFFILIAAALTVWFWLIRRRRR
jgi:hypothetical protein